MLVVCGHLGVSDFRRYQIVIFRRGKRSLSIRRTRTHADVRTSAHPSYAGDKSDTRTRGHVTGQNDGMDREGRQELHYRALEGDVAGIRERLAAGDDVGLADKQGFTALHFAAQQSQTEAVRMLLDAGAPVDPQDRFGNTPLWRAVFNAQGQAATVLLLLQAGADPDIVNEAGATPRDLATTMGAEKIVSLFHETH